MMKPTTPLDLPNLGPKSAQVLAAIGIENLAQLRRVGAVEAYVRARRSNSRVSLNLLWALEGALSGMPWRQVAHQHRTSLLLAVEEHEHRCAAKAATR
jgi:DNA transformation protein